MFKRKAHAQTIKTVIGENTVVEGDLVFSSGLHIDGTVRGDVISDDEQSSLLLVSEVGTIEGNVRVANVVINGTIIGNVVASERVELAPDARVTGTVYYKLLEMAMGSEVNGQLVCTEEQQQRMREFEEKLVETGDDEGVERILD